MGWVGMALWSTVFCSGMDLDAKLPFCITRTKYQHHVLDVGVAISHQHHHPLHITIQKYYSFNHQYQTTIAPPVYNYF